MDLTNTRKSKESIHSFALSAGSKVRQVTSEFNPTGERNRLTNSLVRQKSPARLALASGRLKISPAHRRSPSFAPASSKWL